MPGFGTPRRITIGKLRHKATIERKVQTDEDDRGQPVYTWQTFLAKVPCALQQLTSSELELARQLYPSATYRISMRYVAGLTEKMRFTIYGIHYYIGGIDDVDKVNRFMRVLVSEDPE